MEQLFGDLVDKSSAAVIGAPGWNVTLSASTSADAADTGREVLEWWGERSQSSEECYYHNAGTCPDCGAGMIRLGTCYSCPSCGWGSCGG